MAFDLESELHNVCPHLTKASLSVTNLCDEARFSFSHCLAASKTAAVRQQIVKRRSGYGSDIDAEAVLYFQKLFEVGRLKISETGVLILGNPKMIDAGLERSNRVAFRVVLDLNARRPALA